MFKKLKVIKIILIVAIGILFFPFDFHERAIVLNGYTDLSSYYPGDTAHLYFNCTDKSQNTVYNLYDTEGNIIDSVYGKGIIQDTGTSSPWKEGFNYMKSATYIIPEKLESGIYRWNNNTPFIIKPKKAVDLSIIIPYTAFQSYNTAGGKSLYSYNSSDKKAAKSVHFLRPYKLDRFTLDFIKWLKKEVDSKIKYGFFTDLDLIRSDQPLKASKTLVFYGMADRMDQRGYEKIKTFNEEGGNLVYLTSVFMNRKIIVENKSIRYPSEKKLSFWSNNISDSSLYAIAGPHLSQGKKERKTYQWKIHKKFRIEPNDSILKINSGNIAGIPITNSSTPLPYANFRPEEVSIIGYSRISNQKAGFIMQFSPMKTAGTISTTSTLGWTYHEALENSFTRSVTRHFLYLDQ